MTPNEFIKILKTQEKIIKVAKLVISEARERAEKCPPPKNRRPAEPDDIVPGAIIWHVRSKKHGGDYWNIVDEQLHYGDPFKAYSADDGCRYGLDGAYIDCG